MAKSPDDSITEVTPSSPGQDSMIIDHVDPADVSCPLCSEQFQDKAHVAKHLQDSHDIGNMYVCTVCQHVCWSNKAFIQHMKDHQSQSGAVVTRFSDHAGRRKHTPKKVEKGEIKLVLQENIKALLKQGINKQKDSKKAKKTETKSKQKTKGLTKVKKNLKGKKTKPALAKKVPINKKKILKEAKSLADGIKTKGKDSDSSATEIDDDLADPTYNDIKRDKTVECKECGKTYASKRALRRHIDVMHQQTRHICDFCGQNYKGRDSLNRHIRALHMKEKIYKCTVPGCTAAYNFNHSLKLHLLKHSGERPHACSICMKTYLTAHHLKIHYQAVHSDSKDFVCRYCDKKFSYSTSHKMHERTHNKDRPCPCPHCDKSFVNRQALKYHVMAKHTAGSYKCDVCNKEYKTEFLLRSHKRRHTSDSTRYMCDICGNRFMYQSALELHRSVHKDEKDYQCKTCGKSFKTYPTLYSHQYVHKDGNPFTCSICNKAFKTKERCKAHERRHSGLKPFECSICHHCFPDKGGLQKHLRTVHCAVKKFVCEICGKATSRADNLRVHMKVHGKPLTEARIAKTDKSGSMPTIFDTDTVKTEKEAPKKRKKVPLSGAEGFDLHEAKTVLAQSNSSDIFIHNNNGYTTNADESSRQEHTSNVNSDVNRVPNVVQQEPVTIAQSAMTESSMNIPVQIIQSQEVPTAPIAAHNFPTLQPAYMYTWPYMYQAGVQPSQGGSNSYFQ